MKILKNTGMTNEKFLTFVTTEKNYLYLMAYGYLGHEQDALEAVDEAVFLGLVHLEKLKKEEFLKTWLIRILINECKRMLRQRKRMVVTDDIPESAAPSSHPDFALQMSVEDLPDELREVILLRYYGDLSIKEASDILSLPQGTVATRTRKALEFLKKDLEKEEGGYSYEVD